jgi:hypothetical protein
VVSAPDIIPGRNAPWRHAACVPDRRLVPVGDSPPVYRPRDPRSTPLHRILVDHLETLLAIDEDDPMALRSCQGLGPLPAHVERAARAYLECGLFSAGCARVRCPECELEYLLPFSCKQRYLCPSCHQRKSLLWADWLADEVMDLGVPHRQWVFTIPKRIRPFFRFDPSLLGELPRVAARVLTAFFAEVSGRSDLKPGIVSVTQTFNSDLTWNPHAHQFATDGVLGPDGSFRRVSITRRRDLKLIEEAFRREILGLLRARDLLTEDDVEGMLAWPHSGFGVHNEVKVLPGDREGIIDLAKYLSRPPVALSRLSYDGELVRLRLRRPHWRTGQRQLIFKPVEFLARFLQHVPPVGHKLWREYGAYSTVTRARWRALAETEEPASTHDAPAPAANPTPADSPGRSQCTSAWAALLSRVWGFDPLDCPRCGSRMEIVAFIHDADSLTRITSHYGLDTDIPALAPARGPPNASQGELFIDDGPFDEAFVVDPAPPDEAYFVDPPSDDGLPEFDIDTARPG